jgi:hypothetical protein
MGTVDAMAMFFALQDLASDHIEFAKRSRMALLNVSNASSTTLKTEHL